MNIETPSINPLNTNISPNKLLSGQEFSTEKENRQKEIEKLLKDPVYAYFYFEMTKDASRKAINRALNIVGYPVRKRHVRSQSLAAGDQRRFALMNRVM
jgi:ABC-type antimicrobial peptide transport system ATPase subunit